MAKDLGGFENFFLWRDIMKKILLNITLFLKCDKQKNKNSNKI